ncbi:MAG TPA: TIR domain-containing protein [Actinophytocola sp.]|uniref:TIR domain-containing protein n=1 Tax=Actinophytocola sp. TaxID=1872138 RepID=UPI002DF95F64|nr:TIR domain-containing protein [Actinophytocola sp.]
MLIHFFNDQILSLHGLLDRYPLDRLGQVVERSLLAAVLVSDGPVVVPTVDVVQSPVTNKLLPTLGILAKSGQVDFVGSTTDIDELVQRKQVHFQGTGYHSEWAGVDPYRLLSPLASALNIRQGDTTYDMLVLWVSDIEMMSSKGRRNRNGTSVSFGGRQLEQAYHLMSRDVRRAAYLDAAHELPRRLGDHAFLWKVVQRVGAFKHDSRGPEQKSFERALAYYWVMSHVQEYRQSIVARDEYLGMIDCGLRYEQLNFTFDMTKFRVFLRKIGLEKFVQSTAEEVCDYKQDPRVLITISNILLPWFEKLEFPGGDHAGVVRTLRKIAPVTLEIARVEKSWENACGRICGVLLEAWECHEDVGRAETFPTVYSLPRRRSPEMSKRTIFIGHGRSPAWITLRDLIRDRLGLDWEEFDRSPSAGKTVVQRLSEMLATADFAFLVLTAEDEQADGRVQARQNVVHELGLFQGRLGFDRAIAMIEDGCDEFANLAGLVQIKFPKGNIMAVSEEIRRLLEDRLPLGPVAGGHGGHLER